MGLKMGLWPPMLSQIRSRRSVIADFGSIHTSHSNVLYIKHISRYVIHMRKNTNASCKCMQGRIVIRMQSDLPDHSLSFMPEEYLGFSVTHWTKGEGEVNNSNNCDGWFVLCLHSRSHHPTVISDSRCVCDRRRGGRRRKKYSPCPI